MSITLSDIINDPVHLAAVLGFPEGHPLRQQIHAKMRELRLATLDIPTAEKKKEEDEEEIFMDIFVEENVNKESSRSVAKTEPKP